jgi:uncharacterized membrane protein
MGENHFAAIPSAICGVVLLMAGCAYWILQHAIIRAQGPGSTLQAALGSDWKGNGSPVIYVRAIAATFWQPWLAQCAYAFVALRWLVPGRRIERKGAA